MLRPFLVLALAACLGLAACGDSSNAFRFESKAVAEPRGEPVKIAYRMTPGEGVRMRMRMDASMRMSGDIEMSMPLDMDLTMTWTCAEVTPEGDTVVDMAIESMRAEAGGNVLDSDDGLEELEGLSGRIVIGPDGRVKQRDLQGLESAGGGQLDQLLNNPGFQAFVPMPPEGMRIGEALDLASIMPPEALETLMKSAGNPGSSLRPELKGEIVLAGLRSIGGQEAAEFAVNLVMNLSGDVQGGRSSGHMDMGMRIQGTQYASLQTGLPVGTASVTMEMRADIESGDQEMRMEMDGTITIDASPI